MREHKSPSLLRYILAMCAGALTLFFLVFVFKIGFLKPSREIPKDVWLPSGMILFGPCNSPVEGVLFTDPYCSYCEAFSKKFIAEAQLHKKCVGLRLLGVLQANSLLAACTLFAAYQQGFYDLFKLHKIDHLHQTDVFRHLITLYVADRKAFLRDMKLFETKFASENLRLALICGCHNVPSLILRDGRVIEDLEALETLKWPR